MLLVSTVYSKASRESKPVSRTKRGYVILEGCVPLGLEAGGGRHRDRDPTGGALGVLGDAPSLRRVGRKATCLCVAVARSTDRPTGNGKQEKDATPY